jgi:hypothetical protein
MRASLAAALLLLAVPAHAQHAGMKEITPAIGWQFGGTQEYQTYSTYPAGDFHANANLNYGATLTWYIRSTYAAELVYTYQATDLVLRPNGVDDVTLGNMSSRYGLLQLVRVIPTQNERMSILAFAGFGTAAFGAEGFDTRWLPAVGMGAGVRMKMNPRSALRLQSRILIPIQFGATGFYFGDTGVDVQVGGSTTLLQGDVSLGWCWMLGS